MGDDEFNDGYEDVPEYEVPAWIEPTPKPKTYPDTPWCADEAHIDDALMEVEYFAARVSLNRLMASGKTATEAINSAGFQEAQYRLRVAYDRNSAVNRKNRKK